MLNCIVLIQLTFLHAFISDLYMVISLCLHTFSLIEDTFAATRACYCMISCGEVTETPLLELIIPKTIPPNEKCVIHLKRLTVAFEMRDVTERA